MAVIGPEAALEILEGLANIADGELTPEAVLTAATPPGSPLHEYFTWDDGEAANLYRLSEARALVRRYLVEVLGDNEVKRVRYYIHTYNGGHAYRRAQEVISHEVWREQHRRRLLRDIARLARELKEFD